MDEDISAKKIVGYILLFFGLILASDWIVQGNNFFLFSFFAPRQEAARREVYEHSKSYHQGSIQRLDSLCLQVKDADDEHKMLVNDVISHEFVEWDLKDVPGYLQSCLVSARKGSPNTER